MMKGKEDYTTKINKSQTYIEEGEDSKRSISYNLFRLIDR